MLPDYRCKYFVFYLDDLLAGAGLFNTNSLGAFVSDAAHTTSFLTINSTYVLKY